MLLSLRRLMLLMPLLAGFGAHAASIGEIDVRSRLGEPLQARVPIDLDMDSISGSDCVRIVGPARRQPALATARVTLSSQDGRNYVSIVTDKAINDPVLDLSLRTYCGASLQKDFIVLLSPGSLAPTAAPATAVVADTVTTTKPARPITTPRASIPRRGADTAPSATRHKPVSGSFLKLDYDHENFGRTASGSAPGRQAEQPANTGDMRTPTDLPNNSGATPSGQTGGTTPPNAASGTTIRNDTGMPIQAPVPDRTPSWYDRLFSPYLLLLPVLLAVVGALWLKRRKPRSRFQNEPSLVMNTLFPPEPEIQPMLARRTQDLPAHEPPPVEPTKARPLPTATEPPPPSRLTTEAMEHMMGIDASASQSAEIPVEPQDSFDHVMELAEVMLAFGRSGQAIEALSRHIHANPRQSVDPWLKLLDLYHQSDLHAEFDALATDLHSHYNIAMPDRDDFAAGQAENHEPGPPTLESLPHIMSRLIESWGTQEALDYLNKLLEDNRGGQRLGFSMAMVRDILLLRDILRQICPGSAFPH